MATAIAIGKAKATGLLLKQMFGIEPSYEYLDDYVRVYYQPDRLLEMQQAVSNLVQSSGHGEVRLEWFPVVQPTLIKKALPIALGLVAAGYLIGKL